MDSVLVSGTRGRLFQVAHLPINALSLTTPALARVFSLADQWVRAQFFAGARTASVSVLSGHLRHPNLLSPFPIICSVLPINHLFGHHQP
jgi:hypothetical protein